MKKSLKIVIVDVARPLTHNIENRRREEHKSELGIRPEDSIQKTNQADQANNHLVYMDDPKLITAGQAQLCALIETVRKLSADTEMNFGLDKRSVAKFFKEKLYLKSNIEVDSNQKIKYLELVGYYKYLGIKEGEREENLSRVLKILKSVLGFRNNSDCFSGNSGA